MQRGGRVVSRYGGLQPDIIRYTLRYTHLIPTQLCFPHETGVGQGEHTFLFVYHWSWHLLHVPEPPQDPRPYQVGI